MDNNKNVGVIGELSIAPDAPTYDENKKYKYIHFDGQEFFCHPLQAPIWQNDKWVVLCSVSGRIAGEDGVDCDMIEEAGNV